MTIYEPTTVAKAPAPPLPETVSTGLKKLDNLALDFATVAGKIGDDSLKVRVNISTRQFSCPLPTEADDYATYIYFTIPFKVLAGVTPPATDPGSPPIAAQTITLPTDSKVSAAVFISSSGELVNTLYSGLTFPAGTFSVPTWSGKNDQGMDTGLDLTLCEIRLFYIPVTQVTQWEILFNTSASWTQFVWRSITVIQSLAFAPNGKSIAALGYNEGLPAIVTNEAGSVQSPKRMKSHSALDCYQYTAADATYFYRGNNHSGWDPLQTSYVDRVRHSDGVVVPWPQGMDMTSGSADPAGIPKAVLKGVMGPRQHAQPVASVQGESYDQYKVRLRAAWDENRISGLAVNASYGALPRKGLNLVELYDISTCALLYSLTIPSPGHVSFSSNGELWVISAGKLKRFTITNGGATLTAINVTVSGVVNALAIAAHPTLDLLLVGDGGNSQQVKAFNRAGTLLWDDVAQAGGYLVLGSKASYRKLWFEVQDFLSHQAVDRDAYGEAFTSLCWAPDDSFWVLDTANVRMLNYRLSDRSYVQQISYLPDRLVLAADQRNPRRYFSGNLEYDATTNVARPGDPSLAGTIDPSWTLKYNWNALKPDDTGDVMNVRTHENNHTYAQVARLSNKGETMRLVELLDGYPLHIVPNSELPNYGNGAQSLDQQADGVFRGVVYDYPNNTLSSREIAKPTTYNADGPFLNPVLGPITYPAWKVPTGFGTNMVYSTKPVIGQQRVFKLDTGDYVFTKMKIEGLSSYHAAIVAPDGTKRKAQFWPEKDASSANPQGTFTTENAYGGFDGGNFYVVGNLIYLFYNGQNNGSSNTCDVYNMNAQFMYRLGKQNRAAGLTEDNAPAEFAGNNVDMIAIKVNDDLHFVITVDEAVHAGHHRYRIPTAGTTVKTTVTATPVRAVDPNKSAPVDGDNIFDKTQPLVNGQLIQASTGKLISYAGVNSTVYFIPVVGGQQYSSNDGFGASAWYSTADESGYINVGSFQQTGGKAPASAKFIRVTTGDGPGQVDGLMLLVGGTGSVPNTPYTPYWRTLVPSSGSSTPANAKPTVSAGSDVVLTLPTSSTALASTASDSDGTIASRQWTKFSGPDAFTLATPTAANTNVTGLTQGTYVFRHTVTDDKGGTSFSDVQVIVNAAPASTGPNYADTTKYTELTRGEYAYHPADDIIYCSPVTPNQIMGIVSPGDIFYFPPFTAADGSTKSLAYTFPADLTIDYYNADTVFIHFSTYQAITGVVPNNTKFIIYRAK